MIFFFSKIKICEMFAMHSEKVMISFLCVFVLPIMQPFIYFSHCLALQERKQKLTALSVEFLRKE